MWLLRPIRAGIKVNPCDWKGPRVTQWHDHPWQWSGYHDDVIKWKHFPRYWSFVRGIPRSTANSPHKGQWRGALMFSLICAWINGWVNKSEAGDLRRHRAHYDVIIMIPVYSNFGARRGTGGFITPTKDTLIARFMGPTWGPSGADRTQGGPMLAPWTLLFAFMYDSVAVF